MPVARHPPYSPGRAVFPHPVPRLYSLPRCKAEPSGKHASTFNLCDTGPHSLDAVEEPGTLLPGVTALRAAPPVEPCERPVHRPTEKAGERAGGPAHAVIVVVAPYARMQPLEKCPLRQVPVVLDPGCQPLTGGVELRARGTPHDAGHAVPIWHPGTRASQQGEAPLHARVQTTQPPQVGCLWGTLEVALLQPLGEHPGEPRSVVLRAEGAHPVIGRAAPQCLTPTVRFDDFVTPEVPGLVHIPMCQDG